MSSIKNIIREEIGKVIKEGIMLNEYKDQNDCDIVRSCGDTLQIMHDRIVKKGLSRNEATMVHLAKIISDIRKLESEMSVDKNVTNFNGSVNLRMNGDIPKIK